MYSILRTWQYHNWPAILDGTHTATAVGLWGEVLHRETHDLASGVTLARDAYSYFDSQKRSHTVTHLDGTTESVNYDCCGLESTTDRDGVTTRYAYDAAHRQTASVRLGVLTTNVLDAAGHVLSTTRIGSDNSPIAQRQSTYDLAGRVTAEVNALNGTTLYTEGFDATGHKFRSTTYPDGGSRFETIFGDGSLGQVTGTAVSPVRYRYGVETITLGSATVPVAGNGVAPFPSSYVQQIKLDADGNETAEWTKTYQDALGRTVKLLYADGSCSLSFYNAQGQLWKQRDPDGVVTFHTYSKRGEQDYTLVALSAAAQQIADYPTLLNQLNRLLTGPDRATRVVRAAVPAGGGRPDLLRTDTYAWKDGQATGTLVSRSETSADGLQTWRTVFPDPATPVTTWTRNSLSPSDGERAGVRGRTMTTFSPDNTSLVNTYSSGRLQAATKQDAAGSQVTQTTYGYDAHGRQNIITDARNGATTLTYNNADQVVTRTSPDPGTRLPGGQAGPQVTTTAFDAIGRAVAITQPDGTVVHKEYYPAGQLKRTYGSRTYPVEYTYDAQGRMKTMTTWQKFASGQGAATTTWNCDPQRGWLVSKVYADGRGPIYTYSPGGRLTSRLWARGILTKYSYDAAGQLSAIAYSDGTPSVSYTYDRLGRRAQIASGPNCCTTLAYNDAGQLLSETHGEGPLMGLSVARRLRRRPPPNRSFGPLLHDTNSPAIHDVRRRRTPPNRHRPVCRPGRRPEHRHVFVCCQLAAGGPDCLRAERPNAHDDDQAIRRAEPAKADCIRAIRVIRG